MIQVEDIGFWEDAENCFVSEPIIHTSQTRNLGEHGEVWFTENHRHDLGSIQYDWYYMLPFAAEVVGN